MEDFGSGDVGVVRPTYGENFDFRAISIGRCAEELNEEPLIVFPVDSKRPA